MQRKFVTYCILFFIPILLLMAGVEYATLNLPTNYRKISSHYNQNKKNIELMFLGSSQVQGAINVKYTDIPAINFASGSQHHSEDYAIFSQLKDSFPNLKYVVFELAYPHLEIPHNNNKFWKNSVYLKYYGVNRFERETYFKDKLIYISNPDVFSKLLAAHYISKKHPNRLKYNKFGYNDVNYDGLFKNFKYDTTKIHNRNFRIYTNEYPQALAYNTKFLKKMLDEAKAANLKTIVITVPTYKTYNKSRNPNILRRRDSLLKVIQREYDNVSVLNLENDTINFKVTDFLNENHLNPTGGEKVTKMFNTFLKDSVMVD